MTEPLTPEQCAAIHNRVAAFCCAKTSERMQLATNSERMHDLITDFNALVAEVARLHDLLAVPAQLMMEIHP